MPYYRIPVATCIKCEHKIYSEDDYESRSFVDSSGNNAREYYHKNCPCHKMKIIKSYIVKKCQDCSVTLEEEV